MHYFPGTDNCSFNHNGSMANGPVKITVPVTRYEGTIHDSDGSQYHTIEVEANDLIDLVLERFIMRELEGLLEDIENPREVFLRWKDKIASMAKRSGFITQGW